jgi:hypothetical protein
MENIPMANTLSIRECGLNEYWLQDQIYENPSCLGLGELEFVSKERRQASGGRLDILLKNPEDDSMYEVEVMLGETDETHIIRTIEYWDNEKRRWPQRQHYAVLVAEMITRRFFNVIQLLSHSIPIIAIQVNIIEYGGQKLLHFSKVLDTYEEPEDGTGIEEIYDEKFWEKKSTWTIDVAKSLLGVIDDIFEGATLRYVKSYIAINVSGNNYFYLRKRSANKSGIFFWVSEDFSEDIVQLFDEKNIPYDQKKKRDGYRFRFTADKDIIITISETLRSIAQLVKKSWQE